MIRPARRPILLHDALTTTACLNCGERLQGPFCSHCGQRVIPPYPTLREMVGDAWHELSGYDGRFARTFRLLMRQPGVLSIEVLEGRRARYVSPIRLYLVASLVYFLVAAAAPNPGAASSPTIPGSTVTINLANPDSGVDALSAEERQAALEQVARAPWPLAPILCAALLDPAGFRARFMENLPRTFFVLVPVFAAIVALFYPRRRFSQHLVFALHLHAAAFVAFGAGELVSFTRSLRAAVAADVLARLFVSVYALVAFRTVYRERWPWLVAKGAGILTLYVLATVVAIFATIAWIARS